MSLDAEEQDDELLALASIYEDGFTSAQDADYCDEAKKGGELAITLDLPPDFILLGRHTRENGTVEEERHCVQHLPPIYLHFVFPHTYPSANPPLFTLSCKWLNRAQLTQLCLELDRLWQENQGDVVMFTWAQFLKDEALSLLSIFDTLIVGKPPPSAAPACNPPVCENGETPSSASNPTVSENGETATANEAKASASVDVVCSESDSASGATSLTLSRQNSQNHDKRAIQDIAPKANLMKLLRDYDDEMRKKYFGLKNFECKVCFMDKPGMNCLEFWPCRHVYCKDCMASYFEVQISEGNFKFLRCPEDKCESEANPKQVQELVSETLYQRWEDMLLSSTLSSLGDIQPCPRIHCQYPVTIEEKQGHCPSCKFVFCGLCRFGWHGVEPCRLRNGEVRNIMESYLKGSEEARQRLEDRYGKKYLNDLKDEYLSLNYLEENSKNCPRCRAKIEKIDGCNKMTCQHCSIYFCWLCMTLLDKSRPYDHYNQRTSPCYNQLFAGVDLDDDFWEDSDEEIGNNMFDD